MPSFVPDKTAQPEILAPAGSFDSLKAAVANGANAVYLGLKSFSARAKAENFDVESLKTATDYAHFYGVRVYLALNTLYFGEEVDKVLSCVASANDCGIDALIIQDLSLIKPIKQSYPKLAIHFSTQCGIHNVYGAKAAKKLGADRIILSREVTIEDIRRIKREVDIEIECFVHGALCVSFSGNCYFSSLVSGYSGNRGKCLQLCRKKYFIDGREGYYLSPKDLCFASEMSELIDAGVCSFKIEGRMRRPEYVGAAVALYKKVISGEKYSLDEVKMMYNRGDYTLAHLKNPTENVIYSQAQGHIGLKVGKVLQVKNRIAKLSYDLKKGDAVKFLRSGKEVGTALISSDGACTGFVGEVKPGDEVSITTHAKTIEKYTDQPIFVPVFCSVTLKIGEPIVVRLKTNRASVEVSSDFIADEAKSSPLSEKDISGVFAKCKDFGFELGSCEVDTDGKSFAVKSQLNAFRREAFSRLLIEHTDAYERPEAKNTDCGDELYECARKTHFNDGAIFVQVETVADAKEFLSHTPLVALKPRDYKAFLEEINDFPSEVYLVLPQIARKADLCVLENIVKDEKIKNVVATNLYALELCKDKNVILGPTCNVTDENADYNKITSIESGVSGKAFTYAYGYFPFMTVTHCPKKTINGSCKGCNRYDFMPICDERGNNFRFYHYRVAYCYAHLLNEFPINLSQYNAKNPINKIFIDYSYCENKDKLKIFNSFKSQIIVNERGITGFSNKKPE